MHKLKLNTDIGELTVLCENLIADPYMEDNVLLCGLEGFKEKWKDNYYFYIRDLSIPKKDIIERSVGDLVEVTTNLVL